MFSISVQRKKLMSQQYSFIIIYHYLSVCLISRKNVKKRKLATFGTATISADQGTLTQSVISFPS